MEITHKFKINLMAVFKQEETGITQPSRPVQGLDNYQAIRISPSQTPASKTVKKPPVIGVVFGCLLFVLLAYFLAPLQTKFLILGVDGGLGRSDLGRTDTMILTGIEPLQPRIVMLSIPRDLWVPIDVSGSNRINTAYFFAEARQKGSGTKAAMQVVSQNFGVPVNYYVLLRMDGLMYVIDAMGGVDVTVSKAVAGFPIGTHHLNGEQALAFSRSRTGSDDFARMSQGQVLIKAVFVRLLQPAAWQHLPAVLQASQDAISTNVPVWLWPRLGAAVLRLGPGNIESRVVSREMVRPFTTSQGAQVLAPNWDAIGKVTHELFGK